MDAHAHGGWILPPPDAPGHGPEASENEPEGAGPHLAVGGVQEEAAGELGRPLGLGGPVPDPRELPVEPELAQVPLRVEDVGAQELAAVGQPVGHEVDDGVRVDALLRAHVAGLEQGAPPQVLDPLPDRVVHLVLRLYPAAVNAGE